MEEAASGGREPGLRCAEHTELLSLIISGEEEATRERREEDGLANGHGGEESGAGMVIPVGSPCTSYWSITEGPDQPLLLSPAPGPPGRKPRVQRASRPGLSRIPGRDHRRYYHEYWRSEYLMDFDPQRHGMICMVCGSSLATLKLSTIKRHIRQKHPDSLLWSAADKEVIRSGWESHLSLGAGQRSYGTTDGALPQVKEEQLDSGQPAAAEPLDPEPQGEESPDPLILSPKPEEEVEVLQPQKQEEPDLSGPSTRTLERYLNDSLHAWFRQEFLMEYEAEAGRLLCMVCGGELPSLHLDHIKSHVLDTHPNSLVYSSEEKHCILQAWAHTHEDSENSIKSEPSTKESGVDLFAQEAEATPINMDLYPESDGTLTQDTCLIGEDGGVAAPQQGARPHRRPRKRQLPGVNPWRLRLDYLVAYGPQGQDTFCMVCSQVLHQNKVSSFRRHIKENHPETTTLSPQEREAMAAAWTKDYSSDDAQSQDAEISPREEIHDDTDVLTPAKRVKKEEGEKKSKVKDGSSSSSSSSSSTTTTPAARHSHYPGKDQRRNYQARWRMDYLMDYDCRRHGLICIVCGATLATLKVSTIKRHIQQVHPLSLVYSPEEKQQALLSYNQSAQHFSQSHDCLSSQDHGHTELDPSAGH